MESEGSSSTLFISFRGKQVPVTFNGAVVSQHLAEKAIVSEPFQTWLSRCETGTTPRNNKRLDVHAIELQSVDMFGPRCVRSQKRLQSNVKYFVFARYSLLTTADCLAPMADCLSPGYRIPRPFPDSKVGFVKIKTHTTLTDGNTEYDKPLPGICFLRGNAVAILVALF
jgi:hypothetical protein